MKIRYSLATVSALVLFCPGAFASNVILDMLAAWNVVTVNYTANGETEGSAFVAGTYLPKNYAQFAFNGGAVQNDATQVLWLNQGVANSNVSRLQTGSVVSRVTVSNSQFDLLGNAPGTPTVSQGETAWSAAFAGLGVNVTDLEIDTAAEVMGFMEDASAYWAGLASNSSGSTPGNGSYLFNAAPQSIDGHLVAIFNVSADVLFGSGSAMSFDRIEAQFNGAESILINVSGDNVVVNRNFSNGIQNNESKFLFNFYEATSLTLNSNFRGAVFAPFATVNQSGSNIDGTVVSASLTQGAEIHDVRFESYLPFEVVPEPGTVLLTCAGAVLMCRRRR